MHPRTGAFPTCLCFPKYRSINARLKKKSFWKWATCLWINRSVSLSQPQASAESRDFSSALRCNTNNNHDYCEYLAFLSSSIIVPMIDATGQWLKLWHTLAIWHNHITGSRTVSLSFHLLYRTRRAFSWNSTVTMTRLLDWPWLNLSWPMFIRNVMPLPSVNES